jgi:hypothetical protein
MIKLFLATFLVFGLSMASLAEQPITTNSAQLARVAEQIRQHRIDVGGDFSMDEKTGRFHIIHADKMMMDCGCHQKGGLATQWYDTGTR